MVKRCLIENCKAEWTLDSGISLHSFPLKNIELMKKWINAIPANLILTNIRTYSCICSKHFDVKSFKEPSSGVLRNCLKDDAVPSLFGAAVIKPDKHKKVSSKSTKLESVIKKKICEIVQSGNLNFSAIKANNHLGRILPNFEKDVSTHEGVLKFDYATEIVNASPNVSNNMCRLCLKTYDKMYPINNLKLMGSDDTMLDFVSIISKYVPFRIHVNDSKPKDICDSCVLSICQAHNFFEMCIRNNIKLDENMSASLSVCKTAEPTKKDLNNFSYTIEPSDNIEIITLEDEDENECFDFSQQTEGIYDTFENNFNTTQYKPILLEDESLLQENMTDFPQNVHSPLTKEILVYEIDDTACTDAESFGIIKEEKFKQSNVNSDIVEGIINEENEFTQTHITFNFDVQQEILKEENYLENNFTVNSEPEQERETLVSPKLKRNTSLTKWKADKILGRIIQAKTKNVPKNSSYKACVICKTTLGDFDDIIAHYELAHLDSQMCILCGKIVQKTSVGHMRSHLRNHRKGDFRCDNCHVFFRSIREKKEHIENGHKDPLICHICGKKFSKRHKKYTHMVSHTNTKSHTCSICGKSFAYDNGLKRHTMVVHKGRRFLCPECNLKFTTRMCLRAHIGTFHATKASHYNDFQKVELGELATLERKAKYKSFNKNLICTICSKKCETKTLYDSHMMKHRDQNIWQCRHCGLNFDDKIDLQRHISTSHGKHKCQFCDEGFPFPSILRRHLASVHGQKGYGFTCDVCGKVLIDRQTLDIHMRLHTGERPHVCEVCGKSFRQTAHLRAHMYQHTEKPLKCPYCTKRFVFRSELEPHIRTHTGEKPYACSKCGRKFHHKINLSRHYGLHFGIKRHSKRKNEVQINTESSEASATSTFHNMYQRSLGE